MRYPCTPIRMVKIIRLIGLMINQNGLLSPAGRTPTLEKSVPVSLQVKRTATM